MEKGHLREAEAALRKLSKETVAKPRNRPSIAALWNNLGVQQEKYGGAQLSAQALKKAAALAPDNPTIHLNLTQAYWELRDPAMTQEFLERVIRLAPNDPFPRLTLAEILMNKGNATLASRHLDETSPAVHHHPDLDAYARRLRARLPLVAATPEHSQPTSQQSLRTPADLLPPVASTDHRTGTTVAQPTNTSAPLPSPQPLADSMPRQFMPRSTNRYTVRFDGREDQETWVRLRAILEYAYQDISQKFGYTPPMPIAVVLHTNQKFDNPSGTPSWADTLFDESGGVIHVPGQGALDDLGVLSRVVRHEFVHALLHQKLGPQKAGMPRWLVEGLAIQLAEDPWPDLEEAKTHAAALIPLQTLETGWKTLASDQAALAYLESTVATQSLVDRYSMYEVRQLVNMIHAGQTFATAMRNKLSISYDSFERHWASGLAPALQQQKS
jgi:hypothetical protein